MCNEQGGFGGRSGEKLGVDGARPTGKIRRECGGRSAEKVGQQSGFKKQCPPRLSTRVEDEWDGMARGQGA